MIRVLLAEDSRTVAALLKGILESDPEIEVVGTAGNGREAIAMTLELDPDLVAMDIHMPVMDGLEATKEIMVQAPRPIIVVTSSVSSADVNRSFDAVGAGALLLLDKPVDPSAPRFEQQRRELVRMVKALADVKVVRRWARSARKLDLPPANGRMRAVGIAASTGGPSAVQRVLGALPPEIPAPILVVQHIAPGFGPGVGEWLGRTCLFRVKVAEDGEPLAARTVYVAPDDRHLGVSPGGAVRLCDSESIGGHRPSATHLFKEIANVYGSRAVGVVLTGMGRDGVEGLRLLRERGGRVVAQDRETSAVFGMAGAAVEEGLVHDLLPLDRIAHRVDELWRYG